MMYTTINQINMKSYNKNTRPLTNKGGLSPAEFVSASADNISAEKLSTAYKANNLPLNNLKLTAFKGNLNKLDMTNIQTLDLPSKAKLIVDTSPDIKEAELSFQLKPNKIIPAKPTTPELLSLMLNDSPKIKDLYEKEGITAYTTVSGRTITQRIKSDAGKTNMAPNLIKEFLFNPELNEEKLVKAKQSLKNSYTLYLSEANLLRENALSGEDISEKGKSINEVTLQDIQSLHREIVNNSEGKVVITVPKQSYNNFKNEIIQSFSIGIPTLQNYQEVSDPNSTSSTPVAKTKIFVKANDSENSTKIRQSFKIIHNGDINDIVAVRLLSVILGESNDSRLYKDLKENKNLTDYTGTDCYEYTENKNICLNATMKGTDNLLKQLAKDPEALKKCIEGFKNNTNDLINNPVTDKELQNAKLVLKNSFAKDLADSSQKNDFLLFNNTDGINYINNYIDAIDKITPASVQKVAQKFLTQPSTISITTNGKMFEENKEYINALTS